MRNLKYCCLFARTYRTVRSGGEFVNWNLVLIWFLVSWILVLDPIVWRGLEFRQGSHFHLYLQTVPQRNNCLLNMAIPIVYRW